MRSNEETRQAVLDWIRDERAGHADVKYETGTPNDDTVSSSVERGDWPECAQFIGNYLKRAELFGFDTPQGLQALGKAGVTVMAYMERVLEAHDVDLPKPGLPSGEIQEWSPPDVPAARLALILSWGGYETRRSTALQQRWFAFPINAIGDPSE